MTSQCNGICRTAYEVGIPKPGIAIAHPDCEEHGQSPTRGDAQGWVDQPPPVAASAGRLPQPRSGSLSPRPPRRRGRRTTAGRPRHPFAVSLALIVAAAAWLAVMVASGWFA